jgi:hypothetical protein
LELSSFRDNDDQQSFGGQMMRRFHLYAQGPEPSVFGLCYVVISDEGILLHPQQIGCQFQPIIAQL